MTQRGRLILASCRSGREMAVQAIEKLSKLQREHGFEEDIPFLEGVDGQCKHRYLSNPTILKEIN